MSAWPVSSCNSRASRRRSCSCAATTRRSASLATRRERSTATDGALREHLGEADVLGREARVGAFLVLRGDDADGVAAQHERDVDRRAASSGAARSPGRSRDRRSPSRSARVRRRSSTRIVFERAGIDMPRTPSASGPAAASMRSPSPCGSAIVTLAAPMSDRSRLATSCSSGPSSSSLTSAAATSFSDSSCADQRVADSYRRAFSIATAACEASSATVSSSSSVKSPPCLLRQVEVAVGDPAQRDRHAEERVHRRMAGREADGARILGEIVQAQRVGIADEDAEDPAAGRQVADGGLRLRVDPRRQEPLEARAGGVDDAEGRVLRAGQAWRRPRRASAARRRARAPS